MEMAAQATTARALWHCTSRAPPTRPRHADWPAAEAVDESADQRPGEHVDATQQAADLGRAVPAAGSGGPYPGHSGPVRFEVVHQGIQQDAESVCDA
jgi:hypothetical protein